ncbi:MAG TPA: M23 family metallopeptidase [Solirubrobacteraceae bacterium]|jgi:murein DD-endopeptidase MepM/ murein hydrolase activator NlpD|nr:M23 family metallopeptidase [Solirubrobacteraceae bacterium]
MSIARKPLIVAATSAATLSLVAPAYAAGNGGSQAPSAPLSGGSEYGLSASANAVVHPVITSLSVPSTSVPGRPPRVTLRIDEPRVGTVNATVAVNDLSTRKAAIVVNMGWVHTGRTLTVRWPRGATLKAGSFHVSVSAHDHHSRSLARTAHSSGVTTLTVVVPAPAPAPAPAPPPTPPVVEAGVPSPAQTVATGAVFPVAGAHSFGGPENRYGAPRSGHVHEGQDILAAEGTPDVAPLAGTITSTSYQAGGAGYYAVEHTLAGFDLMFAHCQAATLAVSAGQAVAAGQQLCLAGQTGDATAPHLHFEMWVGGWYAPGGHTIDPLPYLEAWERAGG